MGIRSENEKHICALCGKDISSKKLTVDHFVPLAILKWSTIINRVNSKQSINQSIKSNDYRL